MSLPLSLPLAGALSAAPPAGSAHARYLAAAYNPFNGVTPSLGPFAPIFQSKIGTVLGVAWALAFAYCGFQLIEAVARASRAKKVGYGDTLDDAKRELTFASAAVVGLVALPVFFTVLTAS